LPSVALARENTGMTHAIRANRAQRFLLPPSMDDWLPSSHPARFVSDLVEALDLEALGFRMSPGEEGRPHFAAELLLSVWLFGWMDRIRSTRALERACLRDIAFVWLTGNLHPDHNTLWRFFRDNKRALKRLFKHVVRTAVSTGLVGFALHALDGTKLPSASSTETAAHRKQLQEQLKKLDTWVEAGVAAVEAHEQSQEPDWKMPEAMQSPEERRKRIRETLAQLDAADVDHLHPKEPEARVQRTREGLRLGYNAQIVVDHDSDLIVAAEVVTDATDHAQLVPMVEEARATTGKDAEQTVADAGYASGEQFAEAERRHLPVIVAVQDESSGKGDYAKSKFTYDAERNLYVCPLGEELPFEVVRKATTDKPELSIYRCHNAECPVRAQCTTDKRGRAIKRRTTEDAFLRQVERQKPVAKQILFSLRKEIVEHVFGIVKWVDGFRRFTAHGLDGARGQWALVCLAVNLRKLLPAVRDRRLQAAAFG
jgi:transposase